MKHFILLWLLAVPALAFGQSWSHLPNHDFSDWSNVPCPWDSSVMIPQVDHWTAYQTLNDAWDGPVDSAICISTKDTSQATGARILLDEIDTSRRVFFRLHVDSPGLKLMPNWLYNATFSFDSDGSVTLNTEDTCNGTMCSGLQIGILIPDSSGLGTDIRWFEYPASIMDLNAYWIEVCQVTEKFADINGLTEWIFKLRFSDVTNGDVWRIGVSDFDLNFYFQEPCGLERIEADQYNAQTGHYEVNGWDLMYQCNYMYANNFLMLYHDTTYPGPGNISYIPVSPVPNTSAVDTIDVIIEEYQSFNFQPFTELIGDTIVGDTLRHVVNLINDGATMCVPDIIELTFGGSTNLVYESGSIELNGKRSCVQVAKDGKLIVGEGSTLHYGSNGVGMLLYRPGGSIELRQGGTLYFEGTFILQEPKGSTKPGEVFIRLPESTSLIFEPGAKIRNKYSIGGAMKLNVIMEGGTIDLSGLSPEDRSKVRLIYPEEGEPQDPIVSIWPNPATSYLNLVWTAPQEGLVLVQWYNSNGQLVGAGSRYCREGLQTLQLKTPAVPGGLYHLRFVTEEGAYSRTVYCSGTR